MAVGSCLLAGTMTLVSSARPWARVVVDDSGAPVTVTLTGSVLSEVAGSLGVVALAGALAILATRRLGRRLAGAALTLAGAALAFSAAQAVAFPNARALALAGAALGRDALGAAQVSRTAWPMLALAGGLLLAAAGLATFVRGPTWPALGSRYETAEAAGTPRRAGRRRSDGTGMWDAIDRGEDPTA